VRVHLDGTDPMEVALEAWERAGLGVGDRLTARRRRTLLEADADVRVREAALNLLGYRARTRAELARKLRQKGFDAPRVEACVARLEDGGLVDDASVAAAFVRDRLRFKPRGRGRLTSELRAKGVAPEVAGAVVSEVFEDEETDDVAIAREVAEGWVARQRERLLRDLASQEWTSERDRAHRRLRAYLARRGLGGDALKAGVQRAVELASSESGEAAGGAVRPDR
jgi:regulatory protein